MASVPQLSNYILTEKLGKGSYATVYKAYRKDICREVVAIKCVDKSSLTKSSVENLLTEISILKKVKHEFIVELKDFQWDDRYIYLILEYCSGGDLSQFIHRKRCLPENIVQKFLQQLVLALQVLRSHNISHMDLKPQNILLSSSRHPVLKLADFGFAQYIYPDDAHTSLRGSPLYMAPEILLSHQYDARVDLWSVGIISYECLFGQAPFSSSTFSELAEKIKSTKPIKLPYGSQVSDECRDLLLRLLQRDPEKRITFHDFFNHPFVDLEHIFSPESYEKGVKFISQAVEKDCNKEYAEAIQLYSEGLRYLVPVVHNEKDLMKKQALRSKVIDYIDRAEQLKKLLKTNCERDSSERIISELEQLTEGNIMFQKSLQMAYNADKMVTEGRYEDAIDLYQNALEIMIKYVKDEPHGKRKELLYAEVDRWMKKAEDLKSYLLVNKLKTQELNSFSTSEQATSSFTESIASGCSIQ